MSLVGLASETEPYLLLVTVAPPPPSPAPPTRGTPGGEYRLGCWRMRGMEGRSRKGTLGGGGCEGGGGSGGAGGGGWAEVTGMVAGRGSSGGGEYEAWRRLGRGVGLGPGPGLGRGSVPPVRRRAGIWWSSPAGPGVPVHVCLGAGARAGAGAGAGVGAAAACPSSMEGVVNGMLGGVCGLVAGGAGLCRLTMARGIYAGCAGIALSEEPAW